LLGLIALWCGLASALPCGPYTVALYEFGRLYYREPDGPWRGIDKDIVYRLGQRSGCQLQTVTESRVRIWDQLARGQLDMTVSGIATPERERYSEFMPYMRSRNWAVVRREMAGRWASMDEFLADSSRRVGVVKGYRHGPTIDAWLERLRAENRVDEVSESEGAFRVLQGGRVDLIFSPPLNLPRRTDAGPEPFQLYDRAPRDDVLACLVVQRDRVSAAARQRLRVALHRMLRDGTVDAILTRHGGSDVARMLRLDDPAPLSPAPATSNPRS
jgi:polar amino acid transport system substrate-binding protein